MRFALILCAVSASLSAQWPAFKAQDTPRTADGKVDLTAPAPKGANGKPDLSGVWIVRGSGALFYLGGDLKPEDFQPSAAALLRQREDNFRNDTDGINCRPPGPKAGIGVGNFPVKIVQTPKLTVMLYEYQTIFRQVFTDGRPLPKDVNPTWMGYSVGAWDGDTFVITTAGYNDRTSLDLAGHPHTEALRMTERFHRPDFGHMQLQVTFDDPGSYKRPWSASLNFDLQPETDLIEYVCENEKDKAHLVGKASGEFPVPAQAQTSYVGVYNLNGRYTGTSGTPRVVISREGDRMMIDPGSGRIPLVAHSLTGFTMEGTGIEFLTDSSGAVTGMVEHWNEGDYNYLREK